MPGSSRPAYRLNEGFPGTSARQSSLPLAAGRRVLYAVRCPSTTDAKLEGSAAQPLTPPRRRCARHLSAARPRFRTSHGRAEPTSTRYVIVLAAGIDSQAVGTSLARKGKEGRGEPEGVARLDFEMQGRGQTHGTLHTTTAGRRFPLRPITPTPPITFSAWTQEFGGGGGLIFRENPPPPLWVVSFPRGTIFLTTSSRRVQCSLIYILLFLASSSS